MAKAGHVDTPPQMGIGHACKLLELAGWRVGLGQGCARCIWIEFARSDHLWMRQAATAIACIEVRALAISSADTTTGQLGTVP